MDFYHRRSIPAFLHGVWSNECATLSLFFESRETMVDGPADNSTSTSHEVLQKQNNLSLCYRPGPARPGHYLLWLGLPRVPSLPVEFIRRGEAVCLAFYFALKVLYFIG